MTVLTAAVAECLALSPSPKRNDRTLRAQSLTKSSPVARGWLSVLDQIHSSVWLSLKARQSTDDTSIGRKRVLPVCVCARVSMRVYL